MAKSCRMAVFAKYHSAWIERSSVEPICGLLTQKKARVESRAFFYGGLMFSVRWTKKPAQRPMPLDETDASDEVCGFYGATCGCADRAMRKTGLPI